MSATAYALPAIEIIDSRIRDWRIGLIDTIADNASSGGLVLGQKPTPVGGLDPALAGCVFRPEGPIPSPGARAALLGPPRHAATCVAQTITWRGTQVVRGR